MVLALPELAWILFWVGALIFCYLVVYIARALFGAAGGAVGWIPGIGGWLKSSLHGVEQRITSTMSKAALGADRKIGAGFHDLARLTDWLGREIRAHANLIFTIATMLTGTAGVSWVAGEVAKLVGRIGGYAHTADMALQRVLGLEQRVQHAIAADVLPRLRVIERAAERTIPKDIAGLRTRTKTIEGELARAWKAIRKGEAALVGTAFVGAIALALGKLGMGWLRCNAAQSFGKKRGCGLWNDLEGILGLLADAVLLTNICTVIPWLEEAFSTVAAPLVSTLAKAGAGLCKVGSRAPAPLVVPQLSLPAASVPTLYLP